MCAAFAEFIRELIVQGTREGRAAARARGERIGRPPAMTAEQIRRARALLAQPKQHHHVHCEAAPRLPHDALHVTCRSRRAGTCRFPGAPPPHCRHASPAGAASGGAAPAGLEHGLRASTAWKGRLRPYDVA
ncbi:hypothetical protein ACIBJF_46660 [Streptomyces sp. NPDC050743]|uniref:hypothetical protein n=1 Tax=Streptomyces sp. NPDC050743 TaxID=3365634 RepID=UPI0037B7DF16